MSVWITNAPDAYDYVSIVDESVTLTTRFVYGSSRQPFRKVTLDDREDGYYTKYQIGRYQSGGYLVMSQEKYEQELRDGYIQEGDA